jgi:hypothetical protein
LHHGRSISRGVRYALQSDRPPGSTAAGEFAGALVANATAKPFNIALLVALVIYAIACARTFFDEDEAEAVLTRVRAKRRAALTSGTKRLDPGTLAPELPYEALAHSPPELAQARLRELDGSGKTELIEALQHQLSVQRKMAAQLESLYDQMERIAARRGDERGVRGARGLTSGQLAVGPCADRWMHLRVLGAKRLDTLIEVIMRGVRVHEAVDPVGEAGPESLRRRQFDSQILRREHLDALTRREPLAPPVIHQGGDVQGAGDERSCHLAAILIHMPGLSSSTSFDDLVDALEEIPIGDRDRFVLRHAEGGQARQACMDGKRGSAAQLTMNVHHDLQLVAEVTSRDIQVRLAGFGEPTERAGIPEDHLEVGDPVHAIQSLTSIS